MSKIWCDFGQLSILTANISWTDGDFESRKQTWLTAIPTAFGKKLMNFGLLTKITGLFQATRPIANTNNKKSYRRAYWPAQDQHCACCV